MTSSIHICGIGPGHPDYILPEVFRCVQQSSLIAGATRHLQTFDLNGKETVEVRSDFAALAQRLRECKGECTVLVSGDTGFHSLLRTLQKHFLAEELHVVPGISSYQYLFAKLGKTYEDAYIGSMHGQCSDLIGITKQYARSFWLTDDVYSWKHIAQSLVDAGLEHCIMHVANRLSYPNETILSGTAIEMATQDHSFGLCSILIENAQAKQSPSVHHAQQIQYVALQSIPDSEFIRGSVPMTKEEVRILTLSKLVLRPTDHILDIGAGTGSVSVQMALMVPQGKVYAIEHKEEAIELIRQNNDKFGIHNLEIIQGHAPEAMDKIQNISRVFIGGSGGELEHILNWITEHTLPQTRVVLNAITLNTLETARAYFENHAYAVPEIVQVAITKVERIGHSDMLRGHSPVFIISTQKNN